MIGLPKSKKAGTSGFAGKAQRTPIRLSNRAFITQTYYIPGLLKEEITILFSNCDFLAAGGNIFENGCAFHAVTPE